MPESLLTRFETRQIASGKSKVLSASEAIRLITPGSCIHLATTHSVPFGLTFELTRSFWGQRPGFELVTLGASVNVQVMLRDSGFLRRIVTSYAGNVYPAPSPALVFQENYRAGTVPIENWSLLTLILRLMAGAMHLPFIPTNSLTGSGMEKENRGNSVARVKDPFGELDQTVVRSLVPDYTLVHGWAADPSGNVLALSPRTESNYGALAAKVGVIASVERIVDSAYVRSHSEDLLVPGSQVLAVIHMPYGAHPSPCRGYPPQSGYAEDDQFLLDFRTASKDLSALDEWARRWVLGVSRRQYLSQLGQAHLKALRGRAAPDAWRSQTERRIQEIDFEAPLRPIEQMVIAMAQVCCDRTLAQSYRSILAGQGTSNLSAWLAYYMLAEQGVEVDLMAEIGLFGYAPRPPQPLIFNSANFATCKGSTSAVDVLGVHVTGARGEGCIGLLGAALVDQYGNVDSTCIPDGRSWLLGSGGSNDVLSGAAEVIVCCPQDPRRLWPEVPYITGPGRRVTTLVTTKAVFRKESPSAPFRLEAVIPPATEPARPAEALVEDVRETTGWEILVSPNVTKLALPSSSILRLLRLFDPDSYYLR
jgi:acyl CoA:acetate/3-ketoacid CoA transferase alpha subunit/acyl CoA:acetate/3-ketoacid CoA transferase beta subunit